MSDTDIPLCVDLDGTLTPVDTLHESLLALARKSPLALLSLPGWIAQGKPVLKREVVARAPVDAEALPWHAELLEWLRGEHAAGRRLVLATASNEATARAVAGQLGIFDEVIATGDGENLSGAGKRAALVARYGERGYDYAGNERKDLEVWKSARRAIVVGPAGLAKAAAEVAEAGPVFAPARGSLKVWIKAARLHQWVKNALIFLPALLGHAIGRPEVIVASLLAFVAFGLCASSVYLVNDLLDLSADRRHKRKRLRPFAAGLLSARDGLLASLLLIVAAAAIAASVSLPFCAVLAGYYLVTWSYSLRLKRAAIVDVLTLAGLYTLRIVAGAAATGIPLSFWLLAFSTFIFLSLGIVKRYTELDDAKRAGKTGAHGRGYSPDDLPLLADLGTAAGYCSVMVMALYINSPDSQLLYRHPHSLWLICPLLLYWISRVWLLTTRGQMNDDPVVFALRDRYSLVLFALVGVLAVVAI